MSHLTLQTNIFHVFHQHFLFKNQPRIINNCKEDGTEYIVFKLCLNSAHLYSFLIFIVLQLKQELQFGPFHKHVLFFFNSNSELKVWF